MGPGQHADRAAASGHDMTRSTLLGDGRYPGSALGGSTAIQVVQFVPVIQVLNPQQRVHVELPLGHQDVLSKTTYGAPGWSMMKVQRPMRAYT